MAIDNRWAVPMPQQQAGFGSPWMPEAQPPWMSPQFMGRTGLQPMGGARQAGGAGSASGLPPPFEFLAQSLKPSSASPGGWVDPNDPWAGNVEGGWRDVLGRVVGMAGQQGMWSNEGDPALMALLRGRAFEDAAARQNAARLGARLQGGGDPYLQAYAALQSQMGSQSDLSRMLGGIEQERLGRRQDFFQDLLKQLLGGQLNLDITRYQGDAALRAARAGNTGGSSLLGTLGGATIGALG